MGWTAGLLGCCLGHGRCGRLPVPRQKFVDPMSGMAGDTSEDIRQPGMRIDVVHLGRDDKAIHGGGALTARSEP